MSVTPINWITPEILAQRLAAVRRWRTDERELGSFGEGIRLRAWINEKIYARAVGEITDAEMMTALKSLDYTYMLPRHATVADSDGPTGTWHLIHTAVYEHLLTRDEYEELRGFVRVHDPRPAEE